MARGKELGIRLDFLHLEAMLAPLCTALIIIFYPEVDTLSGLGARWGPGSGAQTPMELARLFKERPQQGVGW